MTTTGTGSGPPHVSTSPQLRSDSGARIRTMPTAPRVPTPRGRRRPALLALGVALMAVGALAAVWLLNAAAQRAPVLYVVRDVPYGSVITEGDLGRVDVSVDPAVRTVPASELDSVIGSIAATELAAGSLLTRGQIGHVAPPMSGEVLVPLALPAARMPAGGLQPGDRVLVVDTPAEGADPVNQAPSTIPATVVRTGETDLNGVTVVDVTVATGDGPALAARTPTGRIALVVQPRSG
jgi:hypothetical protein